MKILRAALQRLNFFLVLAFFGLLTISTDAIAVEVQPPDSSHEIVDAAEDQRWAELAELIEGEHDPQQKQPDGMTALHWAVFWNHLPSAAKLVRSKWDVNARTIYEVTPLSIACEGGTPEMVKLLLDAGADVNAKSPGNQTPLMTAARTGQPATVKQLIDAGAVVNAVNDRGQTALMWAAAEGNVDAVDVLLGAGADPTVKVKSGFSAMFFAARQGKGEVAMRLVNAGVDINEVMHPANSSGRNPRERMSALLLAVESAHFELAIDLVKAGADPNDQRSGFAPLHAISWVRKTKRGDNVEGDPPPRGSGSVTGLEFVRQIIKLGADVNLALRKGTGGRAKLNTRGATPLLLAAGTADLPLMTLLVELGADPHRANVDGCTPLMAAAGIGVVSVGEEPGTEAEVMDAIRWLVDRGADVNTVDENLETAMHGACYRLYPAVVSLLDELGADAKIWNHKNKSGWTPMLIAEGHRPGSFKPSPETMQALQEAMRE